MKTSNLRTEAGRCHLLPCRKLHPPNWPNSALAIALTGAGISVESGIPSFRGAHGLWTRYDPMEYAHIQAFLTNPAKVWKLLRELEETIARARPNPAHCRPG